MSEISDLSSILQDSLRLYTLNQDTTSSDALKMIQNRLNSMPSVLDEDSLTKLRNGEYELSLKEYTDMTTYNTMMSALYGNHSANPFQNTLNILTGSAEDRLANAKSFIDKMKKNGMSNQSAVRTYSALQKYSLMSSLGNNYNYVNTNI